MNRLSTERSAYLKHSANQKIDWHPWSEEAFEKAMLENRPLFLSSGAVWCHWCHVMAKECFFDDEIAGLLNENFISIKLDRDERPDIDRRYQMAIAAMGSGGGWPLSVFLTHDKKPFFGGTYFPPDDKPGRPGFKKVLRAVIDLYKTKQDEISQYTENLMNALKTSPMAQGQIDDSMLVNAVKDIISEFDPQHGGFGTAPKFPMPGALEFLINRYFLMENKTVELAIRKSLKAMAQGGFYDQVGGGFHRYSTDESWTIPHFEKMADDNAWLLRNYVNAYSVFGDELFMDVAKGIISFVRNTLSGPEGGFYASQDADVTPDDEGGYFTWTEDDFKKTLDKDEFSILSLHLMHKAGAMHHDESKRVLFVVMTAEEIAKTTGRDLKEITEVIKRGKLKLLKSRNERQTPFIDKTLYTSINGMLISSCLLSCRVFRDNGLKEFAINSLERIIKMRFTGNQLYHTEGIKGLLEDYAYLVEALISAYELTGSILHMQKADEIMGLCIKNLWDPDEGGFVDTDDQLLGMKIKSIEDIPHPSANSLCIILMLKLYFMTKKEEYLKYAEKSLQVFSSRAQNIGIHAGYYFCALDAYFNSLKLTLYASPSDELAETAVSFISPYTTFVYGEDKGYVVPCFSDTCFEPVTDAGILKGFLKKKEYIKS
jgi:uncharacterized protein YyaL (SSP411 family)